MNDCKLSFTCSRKWSELRGVDESVRFCDSCDTNVHAVRSIREFERRQKLGHCVAIIEEEDLHPLTMGMPEITYDVGDRLFDPILFRPVEARGLRQGCRNDAGKRVEQNWRFGAHERRASGLTSGDGLTWA